MALRISEWQDTGELTWVKHLTFATDKVIRDIMVPSTVDGSFDRNRFIVALALTVPMSNPRKTLLDFV